MKPHIDRDKSLEALLQQLQKSAETSFENATPIPSALNHSKAFLALEKSKVFLQEWICIGREDEVAIAGDYLTHQIADVPVLVVRQQDKQLCAFVNVCAHRRACLVSGKSGSTKKFTCPYHAWTYDCSGVLIRAPYMEMKQDFDPSKHGLRPLNLETWEGFIYVSVSDHPRTRLADVLAPFCDNIVGRFDMGCYQTVFRESMVWNANWKNLIENFSESYHVPMAHGKTFAQHDKALADYSCGEDSDNFSYHRAAQPADSGPGAAHPDNHRLEGDWRRMMIDFCIFPCHLVTLMPDYLWYISVQPKGADQMLASWGVAMPPEVLDDVPTEEYDNWLAKFRHYMELANGEDKALVEALHRGTNSPVLPDGTYHPLERNLWQFVRYLNRLCGNHN